MFAQIDPYQWEQLRMAATNEAIIKCGDGCSPVPIFAAFVLSVVICGIFGLYLLLREKPTGCFEGCCNDE
jgi:hypothetical protein